MAEFLLKTDRECGDSEDLAININSLLNKGAALIERLEEDDDLVDEYEDLISDCINDVEENISTLKSEFMEQSDSRDYDFTDKELENGIYALVKLKRELAEYIAE